MKSLDEYYARYWLSIICILTLLFSADAVISQTLEIPTIIPAVVSVGVHTEVTTTIHISDPRLVPTTVLLHDIGLSNRVVAQLRDDGSGGDAAPGDGVFTGKHALTIGEMGAAGARQFRVSATFRTLPGQVLSEPVAVFAANNPRAVESTVAAFIGSPPPGDHSHPGTLIPPLPEAITAVITELTGSEEIVVFQFGSLALLGFAVPNLAALDGAIELVNVLGNSGIDTSALRLAWQDTHSIEMD